MRPSQFGSCGISSLFHLFLFAITIGLSGAVIIFHSWTAFSTPSSTVYIANLAALSSLCLAVASFLLHIVLAVRTLPPSVTNRDSRSIPYKQYLMFGLVVVAAIPNALSTAALFRHRDLEHSYLANVVKLVCLLHGFLVETLGENLQVYRMKHKRVCTTKLARHVVAAAVVLQALLFGVGASCLFVIDREILWLLPSLMLWTQFLLSIVLIVCGTASKAPRPLKLDAVFYGSAAIASSCLVGVGLALGWPLTFIEQYLFLQALLVWASYRPMARVESIPPTEDRHREYAETAPRSYLENDIDPDGQGIEMAGIPREPERAYQPEHLIRATASLSSGHASAIFATDNSEASWGHGRKLLMTIIQTRWWRAVFATRYRRARARARQENEPIENLEADDSDKSFCCSDAEIKYDDDSFDTQHSDQASMSPVLAEEKHDPTRASRDPASASIVAGTPRSKALSEFAVMLDTFSLQAREGSHTILSRQVKESEGRIREEQLAKRSPSTVKSRRRNSVAVLPVVAESKFDSEDGLEGDDATKEDPFANLFYRPA